MPIKKITRGKNKGKYRCPKGKIYTKKQVKAYYSTDGWKKVRRKPKKS